MSERRVDLTRTLPADNLPSVRKEPLPWEEPRLEFVEPELVKQGDVKQLTADGFFGTFIPGR
jgi:hypothetical protein